MMSDFDFFDPKAVNYPAKGDFNGHVVTVVLPAGGGEYPVLKFKCKEAEVDSSPCTSRICYMKDLYDNVGWDCLRSAGEIDLAELSARVDSTDVDEPWIDVEP